jgi:hypothetical protein
MLHQTPLAKSLSDLQRSTQNTRNQRNQTSTYQIMHNLLIIEVNHQLQKLGFSWPF